MKWRAFDCIKKWSKCAFSMLFAGTGCRFGRLKPDGQFMKPRKPVSTPCGNIPIVGALKSLMDRRL
jgi:hypothetical protein